MRVHAEDWPQWRGMNQDGVWKETGIPESFPEGGLKVGWRAAAGPGWSSPVIAAGRVYVTDVDTKKPRAWERMLCFDEQSGERLWTHSYEVTYPAGCLTPGQENHRAKRRCPFSNLNHPHEMGCNAHCGRSEPLFSLP